MRKLILALLIGCGVVGITDAQAQTSGTIKLIVQITGTVSISFSTTTIDFGTVYAGTKSVAPGSVTVTYQGFTNGKLSLRIPNSWGTWTAKAYFATPTAQDDYVQCAMFNSTQPGTATFNANHLVTTAQTWASITSFAGDETGYDLPGAGAERHLWFMLWAPPAITPPSEREWAIEVIAATMP